MTDIDLTDEQPEEDAARTERIRKLYEKKLLARKLQRAYVENIDEDDIKRLLVDLTAEKVRQSLIQGLASGRDHATLMVPGTSEAQIDIVRDFLATVALPSFLNASQPVKPEPESPDTPEGQNNGDTNPA